MDHIYSVKRLPTGMRTQGIRRNSNLERGDSDLCNSADDLLKHADIDYRIIWHVRHGQSTGNIAKVKAWKLDRELNNGTTPHFDAYINSNDYIDAPLTENGIKEAKAASTKFYEMHNDIKPTVVVCSPLTRAIQTACIIFEKSLLDKTAKLIIRPEIREFWCDNLENRGRPLAKLRNCKLLQQLNVWSFCLEEALSPQQTQEWGELWDTYWAETECMDPSRIEKRIEKRKRKKGDDNNDSNEIETKTEQNKGNDLNNKHTQRGTKPSNTCKDWRSHICNTNRLQEFKHDFLNKQWQNHQGIAVVSHYGTINNYLNRENWANATDTDDIQLQKFELPPVVGDWWPAEGIARRFNIPNCGWISLLLEKEKR